MQILVRPDGNTVVLFERAAQQRNGHVADFAELRYKSDNHGENESLIANNVA